MAAYEEAASLNPAETCAPTSPGGWQPASRDECREAPRPRRRRHGSGPGDRLSTSLAAARELATRSPQEAVAAARIALAAAPRNDAATRLEVRRVLARALFAAARYRDCTAVLGRLARSHERRGESAPAASAHTARILPLLYLGRDAEALGAATRARALCRAARDRLGEAKVDANTGILHHRLDRLGEALVCFRRARRVLARLEDRVSLAVLDLNRALTHSQLGHARRAAVLFARVRAEFERRGLTTLVVSADYNRACDARTNGRYDQAWCALEGVRARYRALADPYGVALVDLDLAEMALALGAAAQARDLAAAARAGFEGVGIGLEAARARSIEALALARTGAAGAACEALERALARFEGEAMTVRAAQLRVDLASLLIGSDPERAVRLARRSAVSLRRAGMGSAALRAVLVEGMAETGRSPQRARPLLERVARQARRRHVPGIDWQADALLAQLARRRGDGIGERRLRDRALGALDRLRGELGRLDLAGWALADGAHLYTEAIRECLAGRSGWIDGEPAERAFAYAERARARALGEAAGGARRTTGAGPEEPLARGLDPLRRSLDDHYRQLLHRRRLDLAEDDVLRAIDAEERALVEALGGWERVRCGAPAGRAGARALLSALAPQQRLVAYHRLDDELVAFVVGPDGVGALRLPVRRAALETSLRDLDYQIQGAMHGTEFARRHAGARLRSTEQVLDDLGRQLLAPLGDRLAGRSLVVIPTGPLHQVPFAAVRLAGRYLAETTTTIVAPSALAFAELTARQRPTRAGSALVVGVGDATVPEVSSEARAVADLFPGSRLLLGAAADRATVIREMRGCSLVHLATHGLLRPERPTLSSLLLADGWLTLQDVLGLALEADLVTLSACQTARGQIATGDEVLALGRGFLRAGACSVLASQWALDDGSARRLMHGFYSRYRSGAGKAEALRGAMLEEREREPHPYHWAPLVLAGAG